MSESADDAELSGGQPPARDVVIRLLPGSEPVCGHVQAEAGVITPFSGWLELATILDHIRRS